MDLCDECTDNVHTGEEGIDNKTEKESNSSILGELGKYPGIPEIIAVFKTENSSCKTEGNLWKEAVTQSVESYKNLSGEAKILA
jgi:hypothetical protein